MALTDLDFRHKFVIDNPETPPYGPCSRILAFYKSGMPIRDRSITSLWSQTRDRPSRIGIRLNPNKFNVDSAVNLKKLF